MGITVGGIVGWPGYGYYGWGSRDWWESQAPFSQHCTNLLVQPPTEEPLTLDEGKLAAGLGWTAGDPRDAMMLRFIASARSRVEHDTGLALLTQTRRVTYDVLQAPVIVLPAQARPVQEILAIQNTDYFGTVSTIDPALYVVDEEAGRIYFRPGAGIYWGLRPFLGWQIDLIAGRVDVTDLLARDPALVQAVAVLTGHFATLGRDIAFTGGRLEEIPENYTALLSAYVPVTVA